MLLKTAIDTLVVRLSTNDRKAKRDPAKKNNTHTGKKIRAVYSKAYTDKQDNRVICLFYFAQSNRNLECLTFKKATEADSISVSSGLCKHKDRVL